MAQQLGTVDYGALAAQARQPGTTPATAPPPMPTTTTTPPTVTPVDYTALAARARLSDEAQAERIVAGYKNYQPPRKAPGAPPRPQSFERTGTQQVVEGLRDYSVLPTVGSVVGGLGGALAGGPTVWGVPVTAVAGAGAGAVGGERAQIALERTVGLHGAPPVPRMLREGAFGVVGEGVATPALRAVGRTLAPFASKVTTAGVEAMRAMKGKVLPAQATESRVLDIVQNIAEGSIFGGGRMREFHQAQEKIVSTLVDDAVAKYGGRVGSEEAGAGFAQALEGAVDQFHQAGGRLYRVVDQLTDGAMVPTKIFDDFTREELTKRGALPGEVTGDTGLRLLREFADLAQDLTTTTPASTLVDAAGKPLREAVTDSAPNLISFEQAHFLRGQLLSKIRLYEREADDVARGIAEQLLKRLDAAMDQGAIGLSPHGQDAWRAANAFWRQGKQQFETKFLRSLLNREPDSVAKALMANNSSVLIRQARQAVPAKDWTPVQAAMVTNLVTKATDVETGQISGRSLLTQIKSLGPSLTEIFPKTADEVKRLGRVLATVQQRQGEGTGRMYIQLAQGSALAGVLTGGFGLTSPPSLGTGIGASGVILLGPVAMSRILTSPRGIRWLTTGLTAPPGSEAAVRAATNLATFLTAGPAPGSDSLDAAEMDTGAPPVPGSLSNESLVPPPVPTVF